MARVEEKLAFEGCRIIFRNFSGNQTQYNPAGKRNFCVVIDDETLADKLVADGWNVKQRPPRDEDDKPLSYVQVAVSYANMPPKIWQITSRGRTLLEEETVSSLDYAEIADIDLIVRPYNWEVNGKSGVKAYVQNMYVTIEEDQFADKYFGNGDDEVPF